MKRFASALAIFVTAVIGLGLSIVSKLNGCFGLEAAYVITIGIDLALIAICINFFVALVRGVCSSLASRGFWLITLGVELVLIAAGMIALHLLPPMHPGVLIPLGVGFVVSAVVGWIFDRRHSTS